MPFLTYFLDSDGVNKTADVALLFSKERLQLIFLISTATELVLTEVNHVVFIVWARNHCKWHPFLLHPNRLHGIGYHPLLMDWD